MTIQEAQEKAKQDAILNAKKKLETEGLMITADEYVKMGSTYKLYAMCMAVMLTHNNLKQELNEMNVEL